MNITSIPSYSINTSYNNYNNKGSKTRKAQSQPSFGGSDESKFFGPIKDVVNKIYDKYTEVLAKGLGKVLDNGVAEKVINATKHTNLVAHMACATSLVLSGFYMKQTLQNKKLDKKKRTTLAVNQGTVAILAGVMAYAVDNIVNKKIENFTQNFKMVNYNEESKILKEHLTGIKNAKTMMIFGLMYRFISPVIVTPLANMIGDKIQSKGNKNQA
jgi:hypothetical protein